MSFLLPLKINYENLYKLKKHSLKLNIDFICTAFDFESLDIVKKIGVNALKIASSDITEDDNPAEAMENYKKGDKLSCIIFGIDAERERISLKLSA